MLKVRDMMEAILRWIREKDDASLLQAERTDHKTFWEAVGNIESGLCERIVKRGISYLPEDCMAYRDGYRFASYWEAIKGQAHILYWFKEKAEIQPFVNEHREYSKRGW